MTPSPSSQSYGAVQAGILRRFRHMLEQARQRGLFASPPYAEPRERSAWEAGYEDALKDIARGDIKP